MHSPPTAPDITRVLQHNRTQLYRHMATRLASGAGDPTFGGVMIGLGV
ncbi:hypothetical protein [Streptomyces sp. NBC_01092]|nr:hypothetical protein OG254_21955 [Streptomyces sp. NBC_01092]